jgi:hypothetical protein
MTSFLALYQGETVSGARLVALTADPEMVRDFAARLVDEDLRPVDDRQAKEKGPARYDWTPEQPYGG